MSDENIFNNISEDSEIITDSSSIIDEVDVSENSAKNSGYTQEENSDASEFSRELENYLPTPQNTDKLKKPTPQWVYSAIASAAVCVIMLAVYSVAVMPNIKPSAVISYVDGNQRAEDHGDSTISDISAKVSPCIVEVSSVSAYRSFFGLSSQTNTGSGIVLSEDGYILTSSTVAGDGSDVKITLPDNKEYTAKLLGSDDSKDIAILKIEASGLTAAVLGNSDNVRSGDMALVIGNLLGGELGTSVTKGIICGVNYGVSLQNGSSINLLQTDAITNTQSAGGCLLNANGEVVGMITYALTSDSSNISFAIPSNDIKNVSQSLIDTGKAPQGLIIGITGSDNEHGVTVESVMEDTPAKAADIKAGDLILKVDGTPVKSISDINRIRDSHQKGDKLIITIYRDGETLDVTIVL